MKKDQEPKTKDVYRLWWEYLKRSENYKLQCEHQFNSAYEGFDIVKKHLSDCEVPVPRKTKRRTKKQQLEDEWWPIYRTWERFGDVFNDSFEEWWKQNLYEFRKNVIDLENRNSYDITPYFMIWDCMKVDPEQVKTLADLIHYGVTINPHYAVVAVPLTGDLTMKEISQQISKIREKRKREKLPRVHNVGIRYTVPIGRVRYDELKRYLQVYDMKQQNMSIREIIKKISPEKDDRDVYVQRQFYSDIQKAKTIIKNVEQGYFPSKKSPF